MESNDYKSGLKIPRDYFETFEDRLAVRLMEEELPNNTGFAVPKGYFTELEDRLSGKLDPRPSSSALRSLFEKSPWWMAAAAIALILILSPVAINYTIQSPTLEEVSVDTIEVFIENGGMRYDSYDIMALLDEQELIELSLEETFLNQEQLEEYLLDAIEDNYLITE
jgi:hypothetical protein